MGTEEAAAMELDVAAKELDNRVNFVIKAKDVLTLDQRRMLAYLIEID